MNKSLENSQSFAEPDYSYGNQSPIHVLRLKPVTSRDILDAHAALEHHAGEKSPYTEQQIRDMVAEAAANYRIFTDPKSPENEPRQFGGTIANKSKADDGVPGVLIIGTSGSSLYDEKRNPNNEGNALEIAYTALKYPDRPVIYLEPPGNGNSTDMTEEEYRQAAADGRLVHINKDHAGHIEQYEVFESLQAMVRALENEGVMVGWVSANASGAHFATALESALPIASVEGSFSYNPTNVSDRSFLGLTFATLKEIAEQRKYAKRSHDPLQLTDERRQMAREVMGAVPKRRIDQARASTHNPAKLIRQQQIFRRGNRGGQAAAVHAAAAQKRQPQMRQTFVFPEFAAQYKRPEDFKEFMRIVGELGGFAVDISDVESLQIPLGQYGHSHYPMVRQTLEGYAFNRQD